MNREIKFRQFISGEWHYWGFLKKGVFIAPANNTLSENERENSQQFTGLFDKNDKEIYEGDIIAHLASSGKTIKSRKTRVLVQWVSTRNRNGFNIGKGNFEVIGNIYENPNLIN